MLFGGLRSQPWRLSPDAAARDLHDFGYSPGFQSTLSSTVATRVPMWLGEIQVPVRVAYGMLDLMLGVFTAPRFAAAIPQAELRLAASGRTCLECLTIPSSWPGRFSTSPLTPIRHHDDRSVVRRHVARERPAQVTRRRLLFLVTCCRLDNCLGPPGVSVAERPGACSRPQASARRPPGTSLLAPQRAGCRCPAPALASCLRVGPFRPAPGSTDDRSRSGRLGRNRQPPDVERAGPRGSINFTESEAQRTSRTRLDPPVVGQRLRSAGQPVGLGRAPLWAALRCERWARLVDRW